MPVKNLATPGKVLIQSVKERKHDYENVETNCQCIPGSRIRAMHNDDIRIRSECPQL
jgi:hypothetical protein